MPTEAVLNQLSSRKVTESLMMQIILHCAPVLKDIRFLRSGSIRMWQKRMVSHRETGYG